MKYSRYVVQLISVFLIVLLLLSMGCKRSQPTERSERVSDREARSQPSEINASPTAAEQTPQVPPEPIPSKEQPPVVPPSSQPEVKPSVSKINFPVSVVNLEKIPIKDATISIYKGDLYSVALKSFASAKTDGTGNAILEISADLFGDQPSVYFVVKVEHPHYIGTYADNYAVAREKPASLQMVLHKAPEPQKEFDVDEDRNKIILLTKEAIGTKVADEPFMFFYGLDIDPEIQPTIASIDAHFVVTTWDKALSTEEVLTLQDKNIDFNKVNSFNIQVEEGKYGYYLYFDIHYEDGSTEQYPKSGKSISYYMEDGFGYEFIAVPDSEYTDCKPLFNENSKMKNKVNIMFINIGEDEEFFKDLAKELVTGKYSFLSQEPFASHKDLFQFWYSEKGFDDLSQLVAGEAVTYDLLTDKIEPDEISIPDKIKTSCYLPHRQIVYVMSSELLWGVKCVDGFVRMETGRDLFNGCIEEKSQQECFDILRYDAVFAHEYGHQFAALVEDYTSDQLLDPKAYVKKFKRNYNRDPFVNYGSYYSFAAHPRTDCLYANVGSRYYCVSNEAVVKECSKLSTWKKLIGNGCGKNGVIDCQDKPEGVLEVTCNSMGGGLPAYGNVVIPTQKSLMGDLTSLGETALFDQQCVFGNVHRYCETSLNSKNRLYGAANEQQICRFLKLYGVPTKEICV